MAAPKTQKDQEGNTAQDENAENSIQLIVFAPVNAEPDDTSSHIYMVCPSSMKVVEVIEKFGDEADHFMELLGRRKKKSVSQGNEVTKNLEDIAHITDDIIEDNSGGSDTAPEDGIDPSSVSDFALIDDELDEDVMIFASNSLDEIFPDDGAATNTSGNPDIDLESALALLDEDDTDEDLSDIADFTDDDDSIPAL